MNTTGKTEIDPPPQAASLPPGETDTSHFLKEFLDKLGEASAETITWLLGGLVIALAIFIFQKKLRELMEYFGIKKAKIGPFELDISEKDFKEMYSKQGMGLPSKSDQEEILNALTNLGSAVNETRLLWVFERAHNERATKERQLFSGLGVDVETTYDTEAARTLFADYFSYDLVICGWESGLQLLPTIRDKETQLGIFRRGSVMPVILYFHEDKNFKQRDQWVQLHHGTGGTASPGELIRWSLAELARRRFVLNRAIINKPRRELSDSR